MNCKNCGNPLPLGSSTCPNCGNPSGGIKSINEINNTNNEPLFAREEPKIEINNNTNFDDPKRKMRMMLIAGGIIFAFFIFILVTVIIPAFKPYKTTPKQQVTEETTVIGDETRGYLTLPGKWEKYYEKKVDTTAIRYSFEDSWIISMDSYDSSEDIPSSSKFADTSIELKKYNKSITDVQKYLTSVADYEAYQVLSFDSESKKWISEWYFMPAEGKIYFISIEGPGEDNKFGNVPNTFVLNK